MDLIGQYAQARGYPFEATPWFIVGLGGVLVLVAAGALFPRSRPAVAAPAAAAGG